MKAAFSVEDLISFYNGYNAVAERVDKIKLHHMHIKTLIDGAIEKWVQERKDIILTGNPGDGKTHLLNILQDRISTDSAYIEKDASQRDTITILQAWMQKKQEKIPFLLAINHAPLRDLAAGALQYQSLGYLNHILEEIDNTTYYDQPSKTGLPNTIVIDLNQREVVTHAIVKEVIAKLCEPILSLPCRYCPPRKCPMEYNAQALSNQSVLQNLVTLLTLVTRRGFHTTMRDLIGLLAYIITGNKLCEERWQPIQTDDGNASTPTFEDYTYYNLLFNGRSRLFEAIQATFDPAHHSDLESDTKLWKGVLCDGWLFPDPVVRAPGNLEELCILKRRYFFEHEHDTEKLLERMLPTTERKFSELIEGKLDDPSEVENLVGMINTFYAPLKVRSMDHNYRLRLWNSHRYSAGNPPGYFAMRSIPADHLTIYRPKANPKLDQAIAIRQDHVLLAVQDWQPGDPSLRIDWLMYQALTSADKGTPIEVQPFYILRRLDLFLRCLGPEAGGPRHIENVEWSDHKHRTIVSVRINRNTQSYEQEHSL